MNIYNVVHRVFEKNGKIYELLYFPNAIYEDNSQGLNEYVTAKIITENQDTGWKKLTTVSELEMIKELGF